MKTSAALFIAFFGFTVVMLFVTSLTANKTKWETDQSTSFNQTQASSDTFESNTNTSTYDNVTEVTTTREVANRKMETVLDTNTESLTQWSAVPGAFESTYVTTVKLSYQPEMSKEPLIKATKRSGSQKQQGVVNDDLTLDYNLTTSMS
jgi:hypothetical protein